MADEHPAMQVRDLAKNFDGVQAVDGVDFDVRDGEIFGFLGPNGAGKTTTINMLTGLARPDTGSIRIMNIDCRADPKAAQHLLGIVPDESNLYPELTGFENLCFCASLYGMRKAEREKRARNLLDEFTLSDAANRRFAGYSKGMKRKLTIAAGIIHSPPILFLDEPTTGIDVASARQIRRMIAKMRDAGTTIFLTTHYIEEAERLCDRVAFIVSGRIVRTDAVADLLQQTQGHHIVEFALSELPPHLIDRLTAGFASLKFEDAGEGALRVISGEPLRIAPVVRLLEDEGIDVTEARKIVPSLEEVFVTVTGVEAAAMKREKEAGGQGAGKKKAGASS